MPQVRVVVCGMTRAPPIAAALRSSSLGGDIGGEGGGAGSGVALSRSRSRRAQGRVRRSGRSQPKKCSPSVLREELASRLASQGTRMGLSTREVSAAAAASAAASSCFRIESCEISSNASLKSALTRRGWGPALAPARRTAALRGGCAVLLVASESEAEEAAAEGVHDEGIDSISLASGVASPSDARRDVGRGISATGRAKWNVVVARSAPTPVRSQLSTVKTRRSLSQPHGTSPTPGCAVSHARPPPAFAPCSTECSPMPVDSAPLPDSDAAAADTLSRPS